MGDSMNELEQVIRHLEAMTATMEGLTKLLRQMAARPWPDYPNGEGIAQPLSGEISAGIRGLADPDPDPSTLVNLHPHGPERLT